MENLYTSNLAIDLGTIGYDECLKIQKNLLSRRQKGTIPDTILFLEHHPVYTTGRKDEPSNYSGISVIKTERGGDVTYHGPGQLVVYPILKLWEKDGKIDVRSFVVKLEEIVIRSLERFGFQAFVGDEPGIWVSYGGKKKKVASMGLAIEKGVSYHGISINTGKEVLEGFSRINPCGLDPSVMGYVDINRMDLISVLVSEFSNVFGRFDMKSHEYLQET
ncbi:lipoyl(octanoyl) transferase LipB [Oxyplasma meridianum]|uniref:Probable octanoyltransferase n=1 Tax=Oxyplasma meridianum TaxID=3073602 RepID=A0AAX4NHT6_9ARCH